MTWKLYIVYRMELYDMHVVGLLEAKVMRERQYLSVPLSRTKKENIYH